MGSSKQFLARRKSVHEIFGGGMAADVILWRREDVTIGILGGTLASWAVFQFYGYTLLSLVSSVLALLLSILFAWSKAAEALSRPPPPLPTFYLSEEMIIASVNLLGTYLNKILSAFQDISRGKNSELFYKVAAGLWLTSKIGTLINLFTVCHISLALIFTLPAVYERCEYRIDACAMFVCAKMQQMYELLSAPKCLANFPIGIGRRVN